MDCICVPLAFAVESEGLPWLFAFWACLVGTTKGEDVWWRYIACCYRSFNSLQAFRLDDAVLGTGDIEMVSELGGGVGGIRPHCDAATTNDG